ncbi:MAG: hypothetical protein LUE86_08770 [Clostridiales bacterium]|nr:hypothetical protein [Clostridiales bacterium]
MDKKEKELVLQSGGKKALKKRGALDRAPMVPMNTGTRVHADQRYKDPKHKGRMFEE